MVIDDIVEKGTLARMLFCPILPANRKIVGPLYECEIGETARKYDCRYCDKKRINGETIYLCYIYGRPEGQKEKAPKTVSC